LQQCIFTIQLLLMSTGLYSDGQNDIFPKSSLYNAELVKKKSVGGNVLYSLEALVAGVDLKPGMNILDLGCGKALSSVFLAKEFDVNVWAVDNFFHPEENYEFIKSYGLEKKVFPLMLDARELPFPEGFFDCIIAVNSYYYFGTDDKYLPYLSGFLKPGGQIGVADICFEKEISTIDQIPPFLKDDFPDYWYHIHAAEWWKNKWEKTGLISTLTAKGVSDIQYKIMRGTYIDFYPGKPGEAFAKALRADNSGMISFFNLVGTRSSKKAFLENTFD
jgi:SAM-dependent methyltransferase